MAHHSLAQRVHAGFPGAVPAGPFVADWHRACHDLGFRPGRCLLLVGVCRDELCFPFVSALEAVWGPAFHLDALGGMLTVGRTGIAAAAGHAPLDPGEPLRYVVVSVTHVGMDASGTFGYVRRGHQQATSRTCGALMAFRDELLTSQLHLGHDPVDPEMTLLRQRMLAAITYGEIPEPVELTGIAARVIDEDLQDLLAWMPRSVAPDREIRAAVTTGVLIHTDHGDWIQAHRPRVWSSRTGEQPIVVG